MSVESRNEAAFRRLIAEGPNKGDLAVVDEVVDPGYTHWMPGTVEPIRGAEGLKQVIAGFRSAFPDLAVCFAAQCFAAPHRSLPIAGQHR